MITSVCPLGIDISACWDRLLALHLPLRGDVMAPALVHERPKVLRILQQRLAVGNHGGQQQAANERTFGSLP